MFKKIKREIAGIMERDPAVKSAMEVYFLYPSFKAMRAYRKAHWFYERGHFFIARWISQSALRKTGIEIHPGAKIGENLFIDHGSGVVIGETTEIGDNCTIYQNVTLGGTGKDTGKRHPTLGNNVLVGAGARVLGPFKVGDNSKIGANAVVLCEVPPNSTVVGVPAHVTANKQTRAWDDIDQIHMPDPVEDRMNQLIQKLDLLVDIIENDKSNDKAGSTEET
jgi:serine O-acetyltransferase